MDNLQSMLQEFNQEAATTKRVLDRVPADRLAWQPHSRSMTLGQLALHVATVPAGIVRITNTDTFDASTTDFTPPSPKSCEEIHDALEQSMRTVESRLAECSTDTALADWHLVAGDKELMTVPRIAVWRSLMLNHWYHHRGQLSVYLRLLDIPVPSIYGPSADENPFS